MRRGVLLLAAALGAALVLALLVLDQEQATDPGDTQKASATKERGVAGASGAPLLQGPPAGAAQPASTLARPTPPATVFYGKVEDSERKAASGATVEVLVDGSAVSSVTTDERGVFEIRVVVTDALTRRRGVVRALGADGSVGQGRIAFALPTTSAPGGPLDSTASRNLGTIRLGPPHSLDVRVVSPCPDGLPATIWLVPVSSFALEPWEITRTDSGGAASFFGLPSGTWLLVALAPGCGRVREVVVLPREPQDAIVLELPEAHLLTVKVQDAEDQSPIPGATVHVSESIRLPQFLTEGPMFGSPASYTTDAAGLARVEGLGGGESLALHAEAEGYAKGSEHSPRHGRGPGHARVAPGQTEATIELHKPITVRWPVKNEGVGIPAHGTRLVLEPWSNTGRLTVPPEGVLEGKEIVVSGWGSDGASAYAVAPGHGIARLQATPGERVGHPTAFHAARKIELLLRLADGSPAQGWFLVVLDGGNNAVKPAVQTDSEGRATMEGLYGGPDSLVNVSASDRSAGGGYTLPLGSVDLHERDGRFEAQIPDERIVRVRLTVQGREVPEGFNGVPTFNHRSVSSELDASSGSPRGVFVVKWRPSRPDATVRISGLATGHLAETKSFSLADLTADTEVVIDFRPAGALRVRVLEPDDQRYFVTAERWDPDKASWTPLTGPGGFLRGTGQRADANGFATLAELEPGRYRAIDTTTGVTSEPVEVQAGTVPAQCELDLRATGWLKGRVVVPEGFDCQSVSVGEVDVAPEPHGMLPGHAALPGQRVNPRDGTFWVRVSGSRRSTFRVYHPILRPHPERGYVTVTGPAEGIVLEAVVAPTATVRFSSPARIEVGSGQEHPIRVRLYRGAVEGPGVVLSGILHPTLTRVHFGGYDPGTYTVWMDVPGKAPVVLEGVVLGTGDTDLGVVDLPAGATFELRVDVKEGQSPPRYAVWLTKMDEPTYQRSTDTYGNTIPVRGIGAGRFRVSATPYGGTTSGIQEEIEFDGKTTVVRVLDAR